MLMVLHTKCNLSIRFVQAQPRQRQHSEGRKEKEHHKCKRKPFKWIPTVHRDIGRPHH